ncbi:MAG: Ig-like domain-containing protein, partial [Candidatus Krumholzibacteriota bacterium]|nr:Ig-like domain-containing protein [Candidatus Krumholzibacteriota bacterium]
TATIRVTDAKGDLISNYNGHAILAANTGPGTISPENIKFSQGTWTGDLIFFGADKEVSFSCIDYTVPPNIGTSRQVEVLPGSFAGLQILLPGEAAQGGMEPGIEGSPREQRAGDRFHIKVRAVDSWWNLVPVINDRVSLVSTDAFASLPEENILSGGELTAPVTLFRAGEHTFEAEDIDSAGVKTYISSRVMVNPGPYTQVIMLVPGEELIPGSENGKAGSALDQSINFAFTVVLQATDDWWNPVTGVDDMIQITSTDPLAEFPQGVILRDGRMEFQVRLSTGGYQLLWGDNQTTTTVPRTSAQIRAINSGFHIEAEVYPPRVIAGEEFTLAVKVTNDAGAVMQEINTPAYIKVQDAADGEAGGGILLNTRFQFLQGQRTIRQTYTKAQSIVLVISDDIGNGPGISNVISIEPGPPSQMRLGSNPPWVGGRQSATVSASVMDEYENGVAGQPVTFELVSGGGSISALDAVTGADGIARATFRGAYDPGIDQIRAVSNSLSADLEIQTALVDPASPGGTITNYPNPFHPDENPTTIAYKLSDQATVTLRIFTLSGGLVLQKKFMEGTKGGVAGLNEILWDGRNGRGDLVCSGGYVLLVRAERAGETIHQMRRRIAVVR